MYINGYVIPVPERKKAEFVAFMHAFVEIAKDFGALEIFENWELEVPDGESTDFRKAVQTQPGEKVVFSWVVWPDREAGAIAHAGMWSDARWAEVGELPVDSKRMIMGGFEPLIAYHKDAP